MQHLTALHIQAPFFLFAITIVALKVNIELSEEVRCQTLASKMRRIDFLGSVTLVLAIASFLLGINLKTTEELPWGSPVLVGLFFCSIASAIGFVLVEKYWAPYPVMPMRLMTLRTPLVTSIGNLLASMSAFSMVSSTLIGRMLQNSHEHSFTTLPWFVRIRLARRTSRSQSHSTSQQ
jgi:hypothetical protein